MKRWIPALLVVCSCAAIYADLALAEVKTDYGASFRLRQEYWENVTDLGALGQSDRDFFRLRSQLWGKVDLNKDYGAYVRLTNEAKYYLGELLLVVGLPLIGAFQVAMTFVYGLAGGLATLVQAASMATE
mgnify:CR=1 FL=1